MEKISTLPWLVFFSAIVTTIIISSVFFMMFEQENQTENHAKNNVLLLEIKNTVKIYENTLDVTGGLFAASEEVTKNEWHEFVKSIKVSENMPGMLGLGYNERVTSELEKIELIDRLERYGVEGFSIKPSGERDNYFPVIFIEPENQRNKEAIGFDIFSEEKRSKAVQKAITTKETTITEKIILVQEIDENVQNGFVIIKPVFSKVNPDQVTGVITMVFRADDFINSIFDEKVFQHSQIKIFDGESSESNLFFDSNDLVNIELSKQIQSDEMIIDIADKTWTVQINSIKSELSTFENMILGLILSMGFVLSLVLLFYLRNYYQQIITVESQKQRDEFESMISHELKTPLVPIRGYCDMLLDKKLLGDLNEPQKKAVKNILTNSDHLLELIQKILQAQKVEMGEMILDLEKITSRDLVNEVYETYKPITTNKNIQFEIEEVPSKILQVDKKLIKEVFTNIILNAIDFVPEKTGKITLSAIEIDHKIRFRITNNGAQIPKDKLENLFLKFYQVDTSHTRQHGGSGLGLAICKGIVEAHGGKIWAESFPKNTSFIFEIPRNQHIKRGKEIA